MQGPIAYTTFIDPATLRAHERLPAPVPFREPTAEEIAHEAYLLFAARGFVHGYDREDWLEAEESLRLRALQRV